MSERPGPGERGGCAAAIGGIVLLLFFIACASSSPSRAPTSAAQREQYDAAVALAASDPELAAKRFEAFVRENPQSALADDAALRLAQLEYAAGDDAAAKSHLGWLIRNHPRGDVIDSARLMLATREFDDGEVGAAYRAATGIRPNRLTTVEQSRLNRLMADIAAARDDQVAQVLALGNLIAQNQPGSAASERELEALIAEFDDEELNGLIDRVGQRNPAARLRLRAAARALDEGNLNLAAAHLTVARRAPRLPGDSDVEQALEARVLAARSGGSIPGGEPPSFADLADLRRPQLAAVSGTLGVVLPLTGPFSRFGEASLRGVLIAAGTFGHGRDSADERVSGGVRLLVRDSGGGPAAAAAAVRGLAADPTVQAIVGPLLASESSAAADAAEAAQVPLLVLTRREEVAQARPYVFSVGLAPRTEVGVLADYAIGSLEARRIAILYPRDAAGEGMKDLFWDAVEARGGRVVGVASYEPGANDFTDPIRSLVGFVLLTRDEEKLIAERRRILKRALRMTPEDAALVRATMDALVAPDGGPLPPIVDFDALFIPDTHERVELIAPALAFNEVRDVRLLGVSGWNQVDLVRIGGRHVEGAVFVESFDPQSRFPFVEDFTSDYEDTFDEIPDALSAEAFDAANLALMQIARGRTSREELRDGILATDRYPGATGVTAMDEEGNANKRPFLLGVRGGRIVPLD